MKNRFSIVLVVMMLAALLVSCAAPATSVPATAVPATTAPKKDTLIVVANIRAETVDPASGKVGDHTVYHAIFDALVKYGPNGTILPDLAESWTVSPDGLTYTFKLRQGVTFHDGAAFTADDVVYTFNTYKAVPLYQQFFMDPAVFVSWEKVDDFTVKFTTAVPYNKVLETMALMGAVLPKSREADSAAFAAHPIGTGPYKFVSFEADGTVKVAAYDKYFLGKPVYANAVIRAPMDASTAVVSLQNGEIDMTMAVPAAQIPLITADPNLEVVQVSSGSTYLLDLMGPTLSKDQNLRQAIFHGIDTKKLVTIANEGIGTPSADFVSPLALGDLAGTVKFVGFDETLAKDFLSKSSYKPTQVFKIVVTPAEAVMAQSVQADLKKLGVETEIEQLDINGWATKVMTGEAEMTIFAGGGITGSVESVLIGLSNKAPYFGNVMYSTPEYEALVEKIKTEKDAAARKELMKQGLIMQNDFANQIPLFDVVMNFAHNKAVTNIEPFSAVTQIFYIGDFK